MRYAAPYMTSQLGIDEKRIEANWACVRSSEALDLFRAEAIACD